MSKKDRLARLRKAVQLHTTWLTVKVLGEDAVSKEELAELKAYGKLPLGDEVGLAEKSYVLGRLRALLKTSEYKKVNYQKLTELTDTAKFTSLEELAIQEAKLHAGTQLKRVADDIAAGAFDRLSEGLGQAVTESMIQEIVRDKTALALKEKQSYQKLASTLVKTLKTDWSRDWRRVAVTELHRAKVRGTAMAIVNRLDVYRNSDGVDSLVSIVPNPDTCEDCSHHYIRNGNPKIFKLSELLGSGSNADVGVSHRRGASGRHVGWKTTLPPLHPRCGCRLVYIPPGMSWVNGKLEVTDRKIYVDTISKAVDQGNLGATIKPPGPKATQGAGGAAAAAASPPSITGAAAPGNTPGPGRPASGGPSITWEYWKGEGQPPSEGGWEQSPNGRWRRPAGSGGSAGSPEQEEAKRKLKVEDAKNWGKTGHETQTVISHLSTGEIAHIHTMGEEDPSEAGINASYRVTIDGNGRGLMKPAQSHSPEIKAGKHYTEGCGTVPHGSQHKNEQAAYGLFTGLGLDHCPPTTERMHDGQAQSVQQWQEGMPQALAHLADTFGDKRVGFGDVLAKSGDPEGFRKKLDEITVMDLIMNSQDRHLGNLLFNDDMTDVKAIDHGVSFGSGMMGFKSTLMKSMASDGFKLKIPEDLHDKLKTTSYGDMKRSMSDAQPWQQSQTFLRAQYMMHLQETEGHLDYKKFQPYMYSAKEDLVRPDGRMWVGDPDDRVSEAVEQLKNRTRPNELFEDFAIDFLDKHAADESSPHHAAAKEMLEQGVFMGPGFAGDAAGYRSSGQHKEYEKEIRAKKAEAEKTRVSGTAKTQFPPPMASSEQETVDERTAPAKKISPAARIEQEKQALALAPTAKREVTTRKQGNATAKAKKISKGLLLENPDAPFTIQ